MRDLCSVLMRPLVAFIAAASFAPVPLAGQAPTAGATGSSAAATWTPLRTAWGDPDIQGFWTNHTLTPFERPSSFGGRAFLTDEEFAQREDQLRRGVAASAHGDSLRRREPKPGAAPAAPILFRSDPAERGWQAGANAELALASRRTSLVIDPPDGLVPPWTPEGARRAATHPGTSTSDDVAVKLDGPEDMGTWDRCITRGLPNTMIPAIYGAIYQFLQTPGYVVILVEMVHEARIIPVDGRPHIGTNIRQWMGDPRGHWEGTTLVVESTNFSDKTSLRGTGPNMRLTERFTRLDAETMDYQFTIDDPQMFTKPWTVALPMTTKGAPNRMLEYACHEGNLAPELFLRASRVREKAAGAATPNR